MSLRNATVKPDNIPLRASHLDLWGKWGSDGQLRYPLIGHLIDTAVVMEWLWDNWMSSPLKTRLAARLNLAPEETRSFMVAAAAYHDVGKANPCFQAQLLNPAREFEEFREWLSERGLPVSGPDLNVVQSDPDAVRRHESLSERFTVEVPLVAYVVAGHHGRWKQQLSSEQPGSVKDRFLQMFEPSQNWGQVVSGLFDDLSSLYPLPSGLPDPSSDIVGVVPLLTGLVCLADWVASAEDSVLAGQSGLQMLVSRQYESFLDLRRRHLHKLTSDTLGALQRPSGNFAEVFGIAAPRPAQSSLLSSKGSRLRLVMVPPGDGKTEAALGYWINNTPTDVGLYFALPTMATADAMFRRVNEIFARAGIATDAALVHGHAALSTFYQGASRTSDDLNLVGLDSEEGSPAGETGLRPAEWFRGRHRALLAPVAIGTVDQLLLGVLQSKYNFVRLAGLAGKTVVLDEIHSYDPYMAALLERFLRWAGAVELDVVLLSATLPRERVEAYCRAYGGEVSIPEWQYPAIVEMDASHVSAVNLPPSDHSTGRKAFFSYHQVGDSAEDAANVVLKLRDQYPDAKIGVILNTVDRTQAVASILLDHAPDMVVVHSRMPAGLRHERIIEAEARFGKESSQGADLLVATQVVEQSVDLDFDILVTDLAPAPSLIQRIGRLWRHDLSARDRGRPDGLRPTCHVLHGDFAAERFPYRPYTKSEIRKTWFEALDGGCRFEVVFPDDVQAFVDAGHLTLADLADPSSPFSEDLESDVAGMLADRQTASLVAIPEHLESRSDLERFSRGSFGDETATRLRKILQETVIPFSAAQAFLRPSEQAQETLSAAQVRELMLSAIPVSGRVASLAQEESQRQELGRGGSWWTNGILRDILLVDLAKSPTLSLDHTLGLVRKPNEAQG